MSCAAFQIRKWPRRYTFFTFVIDKKCNLLQISFFFRSCVLFSTFCVLYYYIDKTVAICERIHLLVISNV